MKRYLIVLLCDYKCD